MHWAILLGYKRKKEEDKCLMTINKAYQEVVISDRNLKNKRRNISAHASSRGRRALPSKARQLYIR